MYHIKVYVGLCIVCSGALSITEVSFSCLLVGIINIPTCMLGQRISIIRVEGGINLHEKH